MGARSEQSILVFVAWAATPTSPLAAEYRPRFPEGTVLQRLNLTGCLLLLLAQVGGEREVMLERATFDSWRVGLASCTALSTMCASFGLIGAAQRLVSGHHPLVRHAADAAYWTYLVHHAQVIALRGVLGVWRAPALVKLAVVVVAVLASSTLSYHLLVRSTPIGALLNGRRYPRASTSA